MPRLDRLQTFLPVSVATWARQRAADNGESVSIFIRDLVIAAWRLDNDTNSRINGFDPARQSVFIAVALDALLASHPDSSLRERTHDAYRRRLEKLGLAVSTAMGSNSHEA